MFVMLNNLSKETFKINKNKDNNYHNAFMKYSGFV